MARKKVQWKPGDLFGVPLPDGQYVQGQALGIMGGFVNVVNVALFDLRFGSPQRRPTQARSSRSCPPRAIFSIAGTGRWLVMQRWPSRSPSGPTSNTPGTDIGRGDEGLRHPEQLRRGLFRPVPLERLQGSRLLRQAADLAIEAASSVGAEIQVGPAPAIAPPRRRLSGK
jgi:hypothetical protein